MNQKTKKATAKRQSGGSQVTEPAPQSPPHDAPQPMASAAPQETVQQQPGAAAPSQHRLQDILPEINDLAQRVGGMKQLAEIIKTLQQSKE